MLVNVHRKATPNRGDLASAPLSYLSGHDSSAYIDILDCANPCDKIQRDLDSAAHIIIGGGGLLDNAKFSNSLSELITKYQKKIIVWGAGSNSISNSERTSLLGLNYIGLRDFTGEHAWVPCASCLSKDIKDAIRNRGENYVGGIGILENNSGQNTHLVGNCGIPNIRRIGNKKVSMAEMTRFISSCDALITSSYHGVYWATLMGIPVIGIPTSSKFYHMKHKTPLAKPNDWIEALSDAKIHPNAWEECVQANIKFKNSLPDAVSTLEFI